MNGKVNGMVSVGSTPVGLNSIDLHVYIVVGDGRAYTAISEVPEPLGWALMPVTPIGGLFGWLFALKLPNSHNGFNVTGKDVTKICYRAKGFSGSWHHNQCWINTII